MSVTEVYCSAWNVVEAVNELLQIGLDISDKSRLQDDLELEFAAKSRQNVHRGAVDAL